MRQSPILAALALLLALPAAAQPAPSAEAGRIIDSLMRGIRVPDAEPPPADPSAQPPAGQPPAGGQQASPAPATPEAAREVAAGTTAPPGVPAVSVTVTFASGSARLSPAAERALAPLGEALASAALAPYRFRIEGHTDTVGPAAMNLELSEQRAAAVRDFLVGRYGVAPARLEAVGRGEAQPLVPTGDEVDEQRNRRVQVLNLGG
jgi:outer membrane protein OmpA-like peptidoglycan-associated protein